MLRKEEARLSPKQTLGARPAYSITSRTATLSSRLAFAKGHWWCPARHRLARHRLARAQLVRRSQA